MGNNVFELPFDDLAEIDDDNREREQKEAVIEFMSDLQDWAGRHGIDTNSKQFKHQAAGIMAQCQVLLMGTE